jgi:hypothetical protein
VYQYPNNTSSNPPNKVTCILVGFLCVGLSPLLKNLKPCDFGFGTLFQIYEPLTHSKLVLVPCK